MKMEIKDWLLGGVLYDNETAYIYSKKIPTQFETPNVVLEMLGLPRLRSLVSNSNCDFQDKVGQFIADAINEKLEREKMENKIKSK